MCKFKLTASAGQVAVSDASHCIQRETCSPQVEVQSPDQSQLCIKIDNIYQCGCAAPGDFSLRRNLCNKACEGRHANPTHVMQIPRRASCDSANCRHGAVATVRVLAFDFWSKDNVYSVPGSSNGIFPTESPSTSFAGIFDKWGIQDRCDEFDGVLEEKKAKKGFFKRTRAVTYEGINLDERRLLDGKKVEKKGSMFQRATSWNVRH